MRLLAGIAIFGLTAAAADLDRQLWKAAEKGDAETLAALLEQGVSPNASDNDGRTALQYAANKGHLLTAKLLCDKGTNVDAADKRGVTALMIAAAGGHLDLIQLLLDRGAKIDLIDSESGANALSYASAESQYQAVRKLLAAGSKIEETIWFVAPDYVERVPATIGLIVEDARAEKSKSAEFKENIGKSVDSYVQHLKYQTIDLPTLRQKLAGTGLPPEEVDNPPIAQACKATATDALLKTRLKLFSAAEKGISKRNHMDFDFLLYECKTGDVIWKRSTGPAYQELGFLLARSKRLQFDLVIGAALTENGLPNREKTLKERAKTGSTEKADKKGLAGKILTKGPLGVFR